MDLLIIFTLIFISGMLCIYAFYKGDRCEHKFEIEEIELFKRQEYQITKKCTKCGKIEKTRS